MDAVPEVFLWGGGIEGSRSRASGGWAACKKAWRAHVSLGTPAGLQKNRVSKSVLDLNYITWMAKQWRRFRWLLWGATALLWPLCLSGIVFLDAEAAVVRLALLGLLVAANGLCLYYTLESRRQLKKLSRIEKKAAVHRATQRPPKSEPSPKEAAKSQTGKKAAAPAEAPELLEP